MISKLVAAIRSCARQPETRRRASRRRRFVPESLEYRIAPAVDILTFHGDDASTGLNAQENQLTPQNVKVGSFGKIFTVSVDGLVYAQPLVDSGLTITAGPNTSAAAGTTGVHDVVFVATAHDSLYAIDASASGGALLWKRSFTDVETSGYVGTTPGTNINNGLGATSIAPIPYTEVFLNAIDPEVGIVGTPVIDGTTGTLYVVVKTRQVIGGTVHYVQRLHAINTSNGTDRVTPYLIGDTTNENVNNTAIYVYGTGDGSVIDPYNGTGRKVVQFNALREAQRMALSLVNNEIYVSWASHGDNGPYHGWVVKWDVSNLLTTGFELSGALNTSPNNGLSGIWQGGGKLAFESDGSAFYFETGNGSGGNPILGANGLPANANYPNALVKAVADPMTNPVSQNANGWGLKIVDFFIPYNTELLDFHDHDLGSGGPMLLPDSVGIPGHPHLMLASGKEGKVYLVDRDNLGKFDPVNDQVVNSVNDGAGHFTPPVLVGASFSTPAFYNGTIYWNSAYDSTARALQVSSSGIISTTSQTAATSGWLSGSAVVSANGNIGGIVWIMDRNTNRIRAYDAATLSTELWNSGQKPGGGDNLGSVMKFATPTVANGQVFVGTTNSLVVYGLTPPANSVPDAPGLLATPLSKTSINLVWTDATVAPNTSSGYLIEQSTDGTNFGLVTTAPPGSTSLALGDLTAQTQYWFRIRGFNGLGNSAYSNTVTATTTNEVALLDFSGGFAGSTSSLSYNGTAVVDGAKLRLTSSAHQTASVFSANQVDVSRFNTQFTFQTTSGTFIGEGLSFVIQRTGATALGGASGGLGYGPDGSPGSNGIGQSVAIKFDLLSNEGEGTSSTGLYVNGAAPTSINSIDLTPSGVDLHSGHPFLVTMTYDGTTLLVTIKDTINGKSASQSYAVDIPATIGAANAYIGFTGGTGVQFATQQILDWTLSPNALQAPAGPTGLGGVPASATSIRLKWSNNATTQTGYHLDRATDAAFTQNLITLNLPATPSSYTDTATGLAPNSTFYYRLRAFNIAGDSSSSNVIAVTIPLAPARPTDAHVVSVKPTRIAISWIDHAGDAADNYRIRRSANHGIFEIRAVLPGVNEAGPTLYEWEDTGLTPNTYYEYHIEAVNVSGNNDFVGTNATTLAPDVVRPDTEFTLISPFGNSGNARFRFAGTDNFTEADELRFQYNLDGAGFLDVKFENGGVIDFLGLADGDHTLAIRAVDEAGNADSTPASFTWTANVSTPEIRVPTLQNVQTNAPLNLSGAKALFITDVDVGSATQTVSIKVSHGTLTLGSVAGLVSVTGNGTANLLFSAFRERANAALNTLVYKSDSNYTGSDVVNVEVVDNGGLGSTARFGIHVGPLGQDLIAPDTAFTLIAPKGNTGSGRFKFAGTDNHTSPEAMRFQYAIDGSAFLDVNFSNVDVIDLDGLTDGNHTLQIRSMDEAGNVDPTPASTVWTANVTAPSVALRTTSTQAVQSGLDLFFSTAESNALQVLDVDGGSATQTVKLALTHGKLSLATLTGLSINAGTGTNDKTVTFTGLRPAVNAALDGLKYRSNPGFIGNDTLQIRVTDNGGLFSTSLVPIAVVAQGPDLIAPETTFTLMAPVGNTGSARFGFAGTDNITASGALEFQYSLDGGPFLLVNFANGGLIDLAGLADGDHTFQVRAVDGARNADLTPATFTWTANVSPPSIAFGTFAAQSVRSGFDLLFNSVIGNSITINDIDAGSAKQTVMLTVTSGTLSLAKLDGITMNVGTGTSDVTMTFTGLRAAVNAALNGLKYTSNAGYIGADTLQIRATDNGGLFSTASLSITVVV